MIANKMLFLFALISGALAENRIACDGVIFHHVYLDRELLFSDRGRPYNLVLHKYSGTLFFSHTIHNGSRIDFGITACHIEKRKCRDIEGVPGGYAIAYDSGNDDIYFGGHDGIYKYNFITKGADFFAEQGKSIWGLFIKKKFYYIEYPSQKLFVYNDDTFVKVAEAENIEVDIFFIGKSNDIYFSNKTALYKIEKGERDVVVLDDEVLVRQIVEDSYGDIYFLVHDGVYIEERPYRKITRVAHIDQAFGMTFTENDNVIYSDENSVYLLKPSNYTDVCYTAVRRSEADVIGKPIKG